jgi:ribosomal protein L11 methyltransferase
VSWLSLRIKPGNNREGIIATLFNEGSQGVHEDGDMIVTHFPPETNIGSITAIVQSVDPDAEISVGEAPTVSWDEWRANVDAHTVGALTVTPPWLAEHYDPATTIVIDPAMAFGTGEHPTTRGVLRLMQRVIKQDDVVADLGAGSAVLSIGAAKLGAPRVVAIELDPDAVSNAQENIARNGVESQVTYIEGDAAVLLPLVAPMRVVLANIISSVLLDLLPVIKRTLSADGQAILSGILFEERDMMMAALQEHGWEIQAEDSEEQWWSVLVTVAGNRAHNVAR